MCKIMEDMRNEAAIEAAQKSAREIAERMIRKGKMTLEEIADYVPAISLEELKNSRQKSCRWCKELQPCVK